MIDTIHHHHRNGTPLIIIMVHILIFTLIIVQQTQTSNLQLTSSSYNNHNQAMRPGLECNHGLWTQLIAPVSDSLKQVYLKSGSNSEESARQSFRKISRQEFESALNSALLTRLRPHERYDKEIVNLERRDLINNELCVGVEAAFLVCSELRRCACKAEFPFEYSNVNGVCLGRRGSICAIGDDFRVGCTEGAACGRGADNTTYYCGGFTEFEKRRDIEDGRNLAAARLTSSKKNTLIFILVTAFILLFGSL